MGRLMAGLWGGDGTVGRVWRFAVFRALGCDAVPGACAEIDDVGAADAGFSVRILGVVTSVEEDEVA